MTKPAEHSLAGEVINKVPPPPQAHPSRPLKREGSLDLLKFLATCTIIMHHYQQLTHTVFEDGINFYSGNFYWGFLVELFFLLSGYFSYQYSRAPQVPTFFAFWGKKYLRFLPLLVLAGGANVAYETFLCHQGGSPFPYDGWSCVAGLLGFSHWFSETPVANNPIWYISVLLLCYAVFYIAMFIMKKLSAETSAGFLLVVCYGAVMWHVCSTYNNFSMPLFSASIARGLVCFFFGLFLRDMMERYRIHQHPLCTLLCGLYLAAFIYVYVKYTPYTSYQLYFFLSLTVFPCVLLLFKCKWMEKLCACPIFSLLGHVAYHAFMWHVLVILFLIQIYSKHGISSADRSVMHLTVAAAMLAGGISFGISKLAAYLRQPRTHT